MAVAHTSDFRPLRGLAGTGCAPAAPALTPLPFCERRCSGGVRNNTRLRNRWAMPMELLHAVLRKFVSPQPR
jgi:hypothetical protein